MMNLRDAFNLGTEIVGKNLSQIDGFGMTAGYGEDASIEFFVNTNDLDWYRFQLTNPSVTRVEVDLQGLEGGSDLTFTVNESNGALIESVSTNGSDAVFTLVIDNPQSSEFLISVQAQNDIGYLTAYDFTVREITDDVTIIEGAVEDNYEENDRFNETFDITESEGLSLVAIDGFGAHFDPDWYQITVPARASNIEVRGLFDASLGNLDFVLTNENSIPLATAEGTGDEKILNLESPAAGTYLIAVNGDRNGNRYNIVWNLDLAEDNYEENDVRATAFDLTDNERALLRKVDGLGVLQDEDWYKVTTRPGTALLRLAAFFDNDVEDIDMELYDSNGFLLARSVSSTDNEAIDFSSPATGEYFVRLVNFDGAQGSEYDFTWAAFTLEELGPIIEDEYEENDSQGAAFEMPSDQIWLSEVDGAGTQTDDDWYAITIEENNAGLLVDLRFEHSMGDIDVELYDDTGAPLSRSDSITDNELIEYNAGLPAGEYAIRVYGPGIGNGYDFFWLDRNIDAFEQNDSQESAYDLTDPIDTDGQPISIIDVPTQEGEDWYRIETLEPDTFLYIELTHDNDDGNIEFELYDSSGAIVSGALVDPTTDEDRDRIRVQVADVDEYFIRVFGDNQYNDYDLLWERVLDDRFEQNDVRTDASDITIDPGLNTPLDAISLDDDWYQVEVTTANSSLLVSLIFTHDDGDPVTMTDGNLDIELYDSNGVFVGGVGSLDDNEFISLPLPAGNYFIRVFDNDPIGRATYQLVWDVLVDDVFEENDNISQSTDFANEATDEVLSAIQLDEDWFVVFVAPGQVNLRVDIEFLHADGDLNLALFNELEEQLAFADTQTDNETILFATNPLEVNPVAHYIRVSGLGEGASYQLTLASSNEDDFEGEEGNNTIETASDVLLDIEGRRISDTIGFGGALNDDWYEVRINDGDNAIVIESFFFHSDETNIDLELINPTGGSLSRSISESNIERINYQGAPGTYFIRVFGSSGGNPYDLVWNSYREDGLETGGEVFLVPDPPLDNDDPGNARSLLNPRLNIPFGSGSTDLEHVVIEPIAQLDEDWYLINLIDRDDTLVLELDFEHALGDIDVAIYRRNFLGDEVSLIQQFEGQTDGERIVLDGLDSGTYLVCVYGYGIVNLKDLPGWTPGSFDPATQDLSDIVAVENTDPAGLLFYDLAEPNARSLGNSYVMRYAAIYEDDFDVETPDPNDQEVNDSLETAATPTLISQLRVVDSDGIIDATPLTVDGNGNPVDPYLPIYRFGSDPLNPFIEDPLLTQLDDDWYAFTVDTGGSHDFFALINFSDFRANLDLFLYDSDGNLLDSSETNSDSESVQQRGTGRVTYFIQVVGENLGTNYALEVRAFFDDIYEENDTVADADQNSNLTDLAGQTLNDLILRDADFYRVDVPADQVELFAITSSPLGGTPPQVDLLDAAGNPVPNGYENSIQADVTSEEFENGVTGVISPEAGTYYWRVTGGNTGSGYTFRWGFNNTDQYDIFGFGANNNTPAGAYNLSRFRLEPGFSPQNPMLNPIQELAFDYALLNNLQLGEPAFDRFGHGIQEADDWYQLQVPSWLRAAAIREGRNITVLKREYYARLSAEIAFDHDDGDINFEIYDSPLSLVETQGDNLSREDLNLLARSETANDIESLVVRIDPREHDRVYFLRVYGDNNANDYSLNWDFTRDDAYEELEDDIVENDTNNFVERAYDLTTANGISTEGLWLHEIEELQDVNGDGTIDSEDGGVTSANGFGLQSNSDDWYVVAVSEGATQIEVDCLFYADNDTGYVYAPDDADIDFEVYFLAGNDGDPLTRDLRRPVLVGRANEETDNSLFSSAGDADVALEADITIELQEDGTFDITDTGSGIYFIRVYFDNRNHPYTFRWNDGVADDSGDVVIIDDYLNGDWTFVVPEDLLPSLLQVPYANADGDRFPNYAEFALALDSSVADYAVLGQTIAEIEGEEYYQLEFLRNKNAKARGYRFIVEETEDLVFDGSEAIFVRTEDVSTAVERVVYRSSRPITEQERCFFRLTVQEPTPQQVNP